MQAQFQCSYHQTELCYGLFLIQVESKFFSKSQHTFDNEEILRPTTELTELVELQWLPNKIEDNKAAMIK